MLNPPSVAHLLFPDSLESIPTSPTGAGWCVTYDCFLFTDNLHSFFPTITAGSGFLFRLQLSHILRPLYIPHSSSFLLLRFPPFHFSSFSSVRHFVLSTLSHLSIPTSDPDHLARLIFSFTHHHQLQAVTAAVPLYISFTSTTLLCHHSEAADWLHGGTPNSPVVRTLKPTPDALRRLKDNTFFDGSLLYDDESCCCMVCLEGFVEHDHDDPIMRVSRLPCSHLFHFGCVSKWLTFDHRCPVCRSPLPWVQALFPEAFSSSSSSSSSAGYYDAYLVDRSDESHAISAVAPGIFHKLGWFLKNFVKNMFTFNFFSTM